MRTQEELQRAHDLLSAVILREVDLEALRLDKGDVEIMAQQCDVLCWVLQHDHNFAFENNLRSLERAFAAAGVVEQQARAA